MIRGVRRVFDFESGRVGLEVFVESLTGDEVFDIAVEI